MNRKIQITGLIVLALLTGGTQAFANGHGPRMSAGGDAFPEAFFKQAHCALHAGEKLGLSEDQLNTIRSLKMEVKKTVIRQQADEQISDVDIYAALQKDKIEAAALQSLVDAKYEGKKAQAKTIANAYLKLRETLTPDQWKMLTQLEKEKMKGMMHEGGGQGEKDLSHSAY